MPKDKETIRIREVNQFERGGFGASGLVTKARVIDIPKDSEMPTASEVVPDSTPLTDWEEVN